ncbi:MULTISPECIES: histidinol phosphate phosphatase domain-containing protein [Methanoculleus]|jgi:histidinol phosphatase-like PHP family hydrolase|uniref:Histidinol phosphatase n=1 Tax=Methanoculleus thermophilus TaxID=2200 RepID=A0A1G8ZE54_9EURY|nr:MULTISPECIES: histidinol phosphate phosphatase domain-containing protein [Methanoculleus]NLN08204.1 histidinol phosphate phosphatase domain-containing protein [Methanoculleus thermophilus]SDK13331.1 Histidinol phosphatase [Methanoculleus thermophilus]HQD25403.1 histidinol phosphate phosphatase domain-containing protein [Methanoculleus thermophilus]
MYDLHTHTVFSDGELLPSELIRRAAVLGYDTLAITDHADASNLGRLVESVAEVRDSAQHYGVNLLVGVELTHVPPPLIPLLARDAKRRGADIVLVHGETVVEPVPPGTNHAACTCEYVDVLAHPGLITVEDARIAAERGMALEITSRAGHNRTNGHVVRVARETGCSLVVDSDTHAPSDLMTEEARWAVALGSGLTDAESRKVLSLDIASAILK